MTTLPEIENRFREIAKSNDLEGDAVELIVKLLAYNRFESDLSTRISLLEALPSRAVNLNSKIEHAVNNMYSIGRGSNSRLYIKIKVTGALTLTKYQTVYSDKFNTLVYDKLILETGEEVDSDYQLIYGQTYTLVLIKTSQVITQNLITNRENSSILEILEGDVSEDYILKEDLNSSLYIPVTKSFTEHIDSSINEDLDPLAFDLTLPSYALRLYSGEVKGFNPSITYQLKYIPFEASNVNESQLQRMSIRGAEIDFESLRVEPYKSRETASNFLYNLSKNLLVNNKVRSNSDVLDQFRSQFSTRIVDCSLGEYDLKEDLMRINYIPIDSNLPPGSSIYELSEEDKESYAKNIMYYATNNIEFTPLYDDKNATELFIDLTIIVNAQINPTSITSFLKTKEYSLGETFKKSEFIGSINRIEGVLYSEVKVSKENINKELEEVEEVTLDSSSYFKLLENFNYTYKV